MAHFKKDPDFDPEAGLPFHHLDKGLVFQERRLFSQTQPDPAKCCILLTKVLYLLTQGERLSKTEATEFFFATTKLFQSDDLVLRRLVYLVLKELSPYASDMIIIISSLTKDINSDNDIYKANAIRVLCCIIGDIALLGQGERYLRQAIVDKESTVGSAALVSGVHLMNSSQANNADIVKRWVSEIGEVCRGKDKMVQYHAVGLLYQIKANDKLSVSKLVLSMTRAVVRSPHARCLLIRFAGPILREMRGDESVAAPLWELLSGSLRHKSDMVSYEAARLVCQLEFAPDRILSSAISVLQMFLAASRPALRFAAVRTLNQVAMRLPHVVQVCNAEMENLISDVNRSIATLAITTLLKTATFEGVDRLVRQLAAFMDDISDEFKIVVVNAICVLTVKFPNKFRTLMAFLSETLHDTGGLDFKRAIVNAMLTIIEAVPPAKELGLSHLCEFIEDCEYPSLTTKILTVIGREGPSSAHPSKLIRYVYNRVILENSTVRAAAVSVLGKFAVAHPSLRESITVLLSRCLHDDDDEVRDRATYALQLFAPVAPLPAPVLAFPFSLDALEQSLLEYNHSGCESPFDPATISLEIPATPFGSSSSTSGAAALLAASSTSSSSSSSSSSTLTTSSLSSASSASDQNAALKKLYEEQFEAIPQLAALGAIIQSSTAVALTEAETEYFVNCVKHTLAKHFVFQFNISNTLTDQLLDKVVVNMAISEGESRADALHFVAALPSSRIQPRSTGTSYCIFARDPPPSELGDDDDVVAALLPGGSFSCVMNFRSHEYDNKEVSPDYEEDEYDLEDVELSAADYIATRAVADFHGEWERLQPEDNSAVEIFNLASVKSIPEAITQISGLLNMQPCLDSGAEHVPPAAAKHILYLAGSFLATSTVLARIRMRKSPSAPGYDLELTVLTPDPNLSEAICSAVTR